MSDTTNKTIEFDNPASACSSMLLEIHSLLYNKLGGTIEEMIALKKELESNMQNLEIKRRETA